MATRWAICGSGKICNDFCLSLQYWPESEHQIVAVAASSKERADKFAAEFNIPRTYGSYQDLATLDDIDVIYIGTIHTMHVDTCLMYINAGKNVICEKPMALTLEGGRRVLAAAKEKGVFFLEAFWSRFFPVYDEIRAQLGCVGDARCVEAHFSVPVGAAPRVMQLGLGGGALMDIGLYAVQAANLVFKGPPERVLAVAHKADTGADLTGTVVLQYSGGRIATLSYSAETACVQNYLAIRGTQGTIQVPDFFWCPTEIILPDGKKKQFPFPDVKNSDKKYNFHNSQGLMYESKEVRDCLLKGLKESPKMPHSDSETIMGILTECQAQLGIKYDFP